MNKQNCKSTSKSKYSRKPKGKDNGKQKSNMNSTESNETKDFVTNDPTWYAQYPMLLDSSGTYKFNTPVGMPFKLGGSFPSLSVPGIMVFNTHVCPGVATDVDSPINVQARRLYTYLRATRSGSALYDPSDVMTYLLAIDSAYNFYFAMKRLVGCVNRSDPNNRYLPEALVQAQGFNFSELQKNVANLTTYLQTYAARLSSFYAPASMTFMARHSSIFSNIYMDKASYKAQHYIYRPSGFYKFVEVADPGQPAKLVYTRWTNRINTIEDIYNMGESLIRPLVASGDVNQISTDIFNAYGGNVYSVADIPMYYMVAPVYDTEMLNQLQNARPIGTVDSDEITQDVDRGILVFNPRVYGASDATSAKAYTNSTLLSVEQPYTAVPYVMTSTRLSLNLAYDGTIKKLRIVDCGSEFIEGLFVYANTWTNGEIATTEYEIERGVFVFDQGTDNNVDFTSFTTNITNIAVLSTFDFRPMTSYWLKKSNAAPTFGGVNFDYDYITVLDTEELHKLHYAALLSEFFVPQP